MTNENFFKHDNKAYTENLNDAILIANAFDYQVPVNIPGMYNNNHYPNDNNIHKVGVADVTIVSSGSLSIGDTSITNNSNTSQVLRLRVYPNFNSFYAWKKLNWTCTGNVTVDICNVGTTTSLIPSGALTNPDNETLLNGISNLQGLKEYDLLITIPANGILNTLSIVFVNNWNSSNRVSASIKQSNVTGLVSDLSSLESGKADTEHTHTKSEITDFPSISVTSLTVSDYNPNIDSTVTLTVTVKDVYNHPVVGEEVTVTASEGNFTQLNGSSITAAATVTATTNISGQFTLTYNCSEWGLITFSANNTNTQINVTGWRTYLQTDIWLVEYNATTTRVTLASTVTTTSSTTEKNYGTTLLNDVWLRPKKPMMFPTYNGNVLVIAKEGNNTLSHRTVSGSVSMTSQYFQIEWSHQGLP